MTKEELRNITPEEMVAKGLLTPAPHGGYICDCGNGSGKDGDGVVWNYKNGGWVGKCFKCGKGYDIFILIGIKYNLTDFKDQLAKANELFDNKITKKNFKSYILKCHKNLKNFVGESYRAISFDTYKKFLCGYDPSTERFIIPTSYNHYLERYTGSDNVKSPKKHSGTKEIFAAKSAKDFPVIFIVEGEFDALSFWEINKPAISFSGSDFSAHQQELFKIFTDNKFIILYDNDDTGKLKSAKVAQIIRAMGYQVAINFLPSEFNDANDFIQADRNKFIETVNNILETAKFESAPKNLFMTLKIPEDFKVDDSGIYFVGKRKTVKFSDVPARIDRIFHSKDFTDYKIDVAVLNRETKKYHSYKIAREDIADHKKLMLILANANVNVNIDNSKLWSKFLGGLIACNLDKLAQIITVKYPGWQGDDFVYPNVVDKYLIDNGTNYKDMFCTKGDKNIWINLLKKNFTDFPLQIVFGTVLAAPLIKLCDERHIQLALIAPSMRGKSALIKFAMSIYGNPNQLKNTFNSTGNSLNDLGWRFNDLPCWIDEFQAANKAMKEQIDTIIYAYENGKSRLRLSRTGDQREVHEFTGSRIFSAEQSILKSSSGQGAYTRLIELTYNNILDTDVAFNIHQTIKNNYGFFGLDWIKYICANKNNIIKTYHDFHDKLSAQYTDHAHSYIQSYSLIATAMYHFNNNFLKFYEPEDMKDFLETFIADNLFNTLPTADKSTNVSRALKDLAESLISRSKQFMSYNRASETDNTLHKYLESTVQPTLGVILKNGDVGFFPRAVKKFLEDDCGYPDSKAIFRALNEIDALDCGNESNSPHSKKIRLGDNLVRLNIVKKEFLSED